MAVNPKLILIASELAGNEKVRKTLLYVLFFSLGLIMLIFVVFIGLISGLLSIAQDNDLRNHWNYYRTSISEIFSSIEGEINSDVKSEVYDFMPEFSVVTKRSFPFRISGISALRTTLESTAFPLIRTR